MHCKCAIDAQRTRCKADQRPTRLAEIGGAAGTEPGARRRADSIPPPESLLVYNLRSVQLGDPLRKLRARDSGQGAAGNRERQGGSELTDPDWSAHLRREV